MKINIKGGGSGKGYGSYILRENKKDIDFSEIITLSGDMELGDEIVKSSNYKDNQFNIILEFKGKISNTKAKQVTDDFQELFMHGFDKSEYHFDAVLHQDTANSHVHIRIPKKNLFTDTTLRLYMDNSSVDKESTDRKRVNLIRDFIEEKYGLEKMKDNLRLTPVSKEEIIQKQRAERGQEPFDFSKKKKREQAQKEIIAHIKELHQAEEINNIDDVKNHVEDLDLEYVRTGHDFKTDTHYLTFKNETGKLSLKGELFDERFYTEFKREDRQKQIEDNRSSRGAEPRADADIQSISKALKRSLDKRHEEVKKRYEPPRARARERYKEIQSLQQRTDTKGAEQGEQPLQHHNSVANNDISSTIISDSQKLERQANREGVGSATEEPKNNRREQVYSHSIRRNKALQRQRDLLYPNRPGGIDGTNRNTNRRYGTTREREPRERTSSYERFSESRESLYSQTRGIVQDRANSRATRTRTAERTREAINGAGEELAKLESTVSRRYNQVDRQSEHLIESAKELTRTIEKEIKKENYKEPEQSGEFLRI